MPSVVLFWGVADRLTSLGHGVFQWGDLRPERIKQPPFGHLPFLSWSMLGVHEHKLAYRTFWFSVSWGASWGEFLVCTCVPHREGDSMRKPLFFNIIEIRNWRGCFPLHGMEPATPCPRPVHYLLSHHLINCFDYEKAACDKKPFIGISNLQAVAAGWWLYHLLF